MRLRHAALPLVAVLAVGSLSTLPVFGKSEGWKVDPVHSTVLFRIQHVKAGFIWGRFDEVSGAWTIDDENPAASSVKFEVKVASIDTNNGDRDKHLKSPDFFNAAQFPTISFSSTSVTKSDATHYDVTGDLTLKGVTKAVTVRMEHTGTGTDPGGKVRMGFEGTWIVKRSDFGMTYGTDKDVLSDEVRMTLACEGLKE